MAKVEIELPTRIKVISIDDALHPTEGQLHEDAVSEKKGKKKQSLPVVIEDPKTNQFYVVNGNSALVSAYRAGERTAMVVVRDGSLEPDELDESMLLSALAESVGVYSIANLSERVLSAQNYSRADKRYAELNRTEANSNLARSDDNPYSDFS